jgi:hypothetical protein
MLNVCPACGQYRAGKIVVDTPPSIVCPACGAAYSVARRPLFILSGAAAVGKTTVTLALRAQLPALIVLDSDILWTDEYSLPSQWPKYFNLWLRMAKNLGENGRPVLLTGAGFGVPANLVPSVEARYFSAIHILALVCADTMLAQRMRARPAWRGSGDPGVLDDHIRFNRWFQSQARHAQLPVETLDTTTLSPAQTAAAVAAWVAKYLPAAEDHLAAHPYAVRHA